VEDGGGHVPVMRREVIEHLEPRPGHVVVDGTAGGGGHAEAIRPHLQPGGQLILLDRDRGALQRLMNRFGTPPDIRFFHANFCDVDEVVCEAGHRQIDGCLADLGVSSLQLGEAARGFSFDRPARLDMRYDRSQDLTADEVVNRWPAETLVEAIRTYGDQPFARRIVRAIVDARPVERTDDLAAIVADAVPAAWRRKQKIHPATRVMQAIRIVVNDELGSLRTFLDKIFPLLRPGGRLVVLAFHSGEDRIVKTRFREAARDGWVRLPVTRPLRPTPEEVEANPRARSARLRVAERLPPAGLL